MRWKQFALLIVLLPCLVSCSRARQLEVDDVLPPNYDEQVVPEFFTEAFGDIAYAPGVWIRCFDCDLDWDGLKNHLRLNPRMLGYEDTTEAWIKVWQSEEVPADFMREFIKAYSSPNGTYHVFAFNLKAVRDRSVIVGSGGDFIITCGPDRIANYQK